MAIKTTRTLPTGYAAEYGRILSLDCLHVDGQRIDAVVGWYKDEAARRDGAQPAEGERVSIELDRDVVDALLWIIYPQLKKRYPDAVDVLEEEDEATEDPVEDEAPEGEEIKPSKETEQNDPVD